MEPDMASVNIKDGAIAYFNRLQTGDYTTTREDIGVIEILRTATMGLDSALASRIHGLGHICRAMHFAETVLVDKSFDEFASLQVNRDTYEVVANLDDSSIYRARRSRQDRVIRRHSVSGDVKEDNPEQDPHLSIKTELGCIKDTWTPYIAQMAEHIVTGMGNIDYGAGLTYKPGVKNNSSVNIIEKLRIAKTRAHSSFGYDAHFDGDHRVSAILGENISLDTIAGWLDKINPYRLARALTTVSDNASQLEGMAEDDIVNVMLEVAQVQAQYIEGIHELIRTDELKAAFNEGPEQVADQILVAGTFADYLITRIITRLTVESS